MDEAASQLPNDRGDERLLPLEDDLQVNGPAEVRRVEELASEPSGHIDTRTLEAIGSHEHIRKQALDLAYDLLRQTNPGNVHDEIRDRFTDVLEKRNWAEENGDTPDHLSNYFDDASHLAYVKSAVQIFETYQRLGERGVELPTHVAVVSDKRNIERERKAGTEKALMFVDTALLATSGNFAMRGRSRLELNFTDRSENASPVALTMEPPGLREIPASLRQPHRPDVWVAGFTSRESDGIIQKTFITNSVSEKTLAIRGAENIIVAGYVGAFTDYRPVESLKLEAEGDIYILQGAEVGHNVPADIVARTGGVIQEGNVTFSSIKTMGDYVHNGGKLAPRTRDGKNARLECVNGHYVHNGGNDLAQETNVVIDDANVHRPGDRVVKTMATELGIPRPTASDAPSHHLVPPESETPRTPAPAEATGEIALFTTAFAESALPADLSGNELQQAFDSQYSTENTGIDMPMELENGRQAIQRTWVFEVNRFDRATSARYQAFKANARRCGWQADAMSETWVDGYPSYYQITLIRPVADRTQEEH